MKRKPKIDKTDASYLDALGEKSAVRYAPVLLKQIREAEERGQKVVLPLTDADLQQILENTIVALNKEGDLAWSKTSDTRRSVFIMAWFRGMQSKGLA